MDGGARINLLLIRHGSPSSTRASAFGLRGSDKVPLTHRFADLNRDNHYGTNPRAMVSADSVHDTGGGHVDVKFWEPPLMSDRSVQPLAREFAAANRLDPACAEAIAELRKRCPDAFVNGSLESGEVAKPLDVPTEDSTRLLRAAFADAAGGGGSGSVVWRDGPDELVVFTSELRFVTPIGLILVGVPVFCDQTGAAEVVVAFAVGAADAPIGLIMATESVPRGPDVIVARWSEHLVAVAYDAVLRVVSALAGSVGVDKLDQPLIPAGLEAGPNGLRIVPQARHRIGRG